MQLVSSQKTLLGYTCYIDHRCALLNNCNFSEKCKYGRIFCGSDKSEVAVCMSIDNTPILNAVSLRPHIVRFSEPFKSWGSNVLCLDLQLRMYVYIRVGHKIQPLHRDLQWSIMDLQLTIYNRNFLFIISLFNSAHYTSDSINSRMIGQVNKQLERLWKC
jgi:hypothetical protein